GEEGKGCKHGELADNCGALDFSFDDLLGVGAVLCEGGERCAQTEEKEEESSHCFFIKVSKAASRARHWFSRLALIMPFSVSMMHPPGSMSPRSSMARNSTCSRM